MTLPKKLMVFSVSKYSLYSSFFVIPTQRSRLNPLFGLMVSCYSVLVFKIRKPQKYVVISSKLTPYLFM